MRARVLALALATIAALTIFGSTGASAQGRSAVCRAQRRQRMQRRESAAVQTGRPRRLWLGDPHCSGYGLRPGLLRHRCRQSSGRHRRAYSPRRWRAINGAIVVTLIPPTRPRGATPAPLPAASVAGAALVAAIEQIPTLVLYQRAQQRRFPAVPSAASYSEHWRRFPSAVTAQRAVTAASLPARTNQELGCCHPPSVDKSRRPRAACAGSG